MDVEEAYTNIQQDDGIDLLKEAFDSINNIEVHTGLITRLMEAMLKHNIFQFNGDL